jgi:hypothetical protein
VGASQQARQVSSDRRHLIRPQRYTKIHTQKVLFFSLSYSYHPSPRSVNATESMLGVGDATRDCLRQSCCCCTAKRPLGKAAGPPCCCRCLQSLTLTPGAWIESHTEVGGVLVRWCVSTTLAVGVAERLGYIVLARESGRGGGETAAATVLLVLLARVTTLLSLTCSCSWATRASRAAT